MSSKALGSRYTNRGGSSISTEPNIRDIIARLAGKDEVGGGYEVSTEPSGEQSYKFTPFTGQTGWLGAGSRRDAAARNMAALQMLMQNQEQKKSALAQEQEQGTQTRLSQAQRAKLEAENIQLQSALQNKNMLSAEQERRITQRLQQNNAVLQAAGVIAEEAGSNAEVYNKILTDPTILNKRLSLDTSNSVMQNPRYQAANQKGQEWQALMPMIKAMSDMRVNVGPNQAVFSPSNNPIDIADPNRYSQFFGPKSTQEVVNQIDPLTGMLKGSKVTTGYGSAGVRVPADPRLLQQAPNIDFNPDTGVNPIPSLGQEDQLKAIQQLMQQMQQMQWLRN